MSTTHVTGATLADVPLLAGADADALDDLAADAKPIRVLAGDWLLRGDAADDLFVVVRGRLRSSSAPAATSARSASSAQAPRSASSRSSPARLRSASVQAVRDSTLLRLPRGPFVELLGRDAWFATAVARELALQLQASGGLDAPPTRPASSGSAGSAPVFPSVPPESLALALARYGSVEVLDASAAGTGMLERAGGRARARARRGRGGSGVWSDLCARQADRTLLVATATSRASATSPTVDLVILGPATGATLAT